MALEIDTITISIADEQADIYFMYFMGYDGGDDYIDDDEHHKKFFEDHPDYAKISKKILAIREAVYD